MKILIRLISKWSRDRNIIDGSTSKDQTLKLIQEVGELSDAVCQGTPVHDHIGDCFVVLNNLALMNGTTLEECAAVAYCDIKDRTGTMRDGIFIKE